MTVQQHAAAVLGLLQADTGPPQLVVLDGFVPTGTNPPYVVVYFSVISPEAAVAPESSNLDYDSRQVDCWIYCHSIGANGVASRAVAGRVATALLDRTPTITGRFCWPIRHIENQPASRDESTGTLIVDQVDVYRLSTIPDS